jgi:hypothetical protein
MSGKIQIFEAKNVRSHWDEDQENTGISSKRDSKKKEMKR